MNDVCNLGNLSNGARHGAAIGNVIYLIRKFAAEQRSAAFLYFAAITFIKGCGSD